MTVGIERRSVYRVASELRLAESVSEPAATPVLHTVHLAQYVFKAFGLSEGGVEAIGDAVVEAMKAVNQAAAADPALS